jgi:adenylate kinase family enzyme
MTKILFLGGPSGSGKSSFAARYLTSLGWIHLEIDQHPKDGITEHNLRTEWNRFYVGHERSCLATP